MKKYLAIIFCVILCTCAFILVSCTNNQQTTQTTLVETTTETTPVTTKEETTTVETTTVETTTEETTTTVETTTEETTTTVETTTEEPVKTIAAAIYDVDFVDGNAVEKNGNMSFTKEGSPVIKDTIVKHDGQDYQVQALNITKAGDGLVCNFDDLLNETDMKNFFNSDFTAEVFYVNRKQTTDVQASFCQTESAGWGLAEGNSSKKNAPYFIIRLGNSYRSVYANTGAASTTELVHVLGVYDKTFQEIRIYINGVFAGAESAPGDYTAISSTYKKAYRSIVLGADYSKSGTLSEFNMTDASFVDAKIYDYALQDDEAMIAYQNAVAALAGK